jgi:hypothetical protein
MTDLNIQALRGKRSRAQESLPAFFIP